MPAAELSPLCSRVTLSIPAIFARPLSTLPTGVAWAPASVSSAVGSARVPSLSFRRFTRMVEPSCVRPLRGSTRSTRNRPRPRLPSGAPSGRASASAQSAVVAEVNHLTPYRRQSPASWHRATVEVRPTSEPPSRSVIH